MDATHWRPLLDRAAAQLDQLGATGWIVGGCLRDALLGLPVRDVDLAVRGDPLPLARLLAFQERMGGLAQLKRGTARVTLNEWPDAHLDLTPLRGSGIEEDLALRDFRINAMALPLAARERFLAWLQREGKALPAAVPELVDPFNGLDDLRAARLDVVGDSVFRDDPGRILRVARLAARLYLTATARTIDLARDSATQLADLADDRVREELNLALAMPEADESFDLLRDMQALPSLFASPVASHSGERSEAVWTHLVASLAALRWLREPSADTSDAIYRRLPVDRVRAWYAETAPGESLPRVVALGWATALHALTSHEPVESGAPTDFQSPLRGLPTQVTQAVNVWHEARTLLIADVPDEIAIRQFFDRLGHGGEVAIDALVVAFACVQAQGVANWSEDALHRVAENLAKILSLYFDDPTALMPPNLIDGAQVVHELGVSQGPLVGRILREIRAEQLAGNIVTAEDALAYARTILASESGH